MPYMIRASFIAFLLLSCSAPDLSDCRKVTIFGDTQYLVDADDPAYAHFAEKVNWVVDNRVTEKIDLAIHVGDIIDHGNPFSTNPIQTALEWSRFNTQWGKLDEAGIPYAIVQGNHDNRGGSSLPPGWAHGFFNHYGPDHFSDPRLPHRYEFETCPHGPGDPCGPDQYGRQAIGHIWKFNIGPQKLLIAGYPWPLTQEAIDWYEGRLLSQDLPVIIVQHDQIRTPESKQPLFSRLWLRIRNNPELSKRVIMTVMGHFHNDLKEIRTENGHQILAVEFDYQRATQPPTASAIGLVEFCFDRNGDFESVSGYTTMEPGVPSATRGVLLRTPFRRQE